MRLSVPDALRAALAAVEGGRQALAHRLLASVQAPLLSPAAPEDTVVAAALINWSARRFDAAFALLDALETRAAPPSAETRRLHAGLAGRLGWTQHQRSLLARAAEDDPEARQTLVDLLTQGRTWEDALAAGAAGMHRAELLLQLGRLDEARALEATLDDTSARRGRLRAALGMHRAALELLPSHERPLARFRAGDLDPTRSDWIGAASAHLLGHEDALARLEAAVEAGALPEAQLWRAEARFQAGDEDGALADIDAVVPRIGGFSLPASLLRQVIEHRRSERAGKHLANSVRGLIATLEPGLVALGFEPERLRADLGRAEGAEAVLRELWETLGSDRAPQGPRSARFDARRCLETIALFPGDEVLRRFDALVAATPDDPMAVVHRGELRFWLGDAQGARRDFAESLRVRQGTRWGFIGQIGVYGLGGDLAMAREMARQEVAVLDSVGPSTHVYLGEALLEAGELDEAAERLDFAIDLHPTRLGAQVSRAVIAARRGEREVLLRHVLGLRKVAAPMLACACDDAGVSQQAVWPDGTELGSDAVLGAVLGRARVAMRGNRSSSCLTWYGSDGTMRLTPKPSPGSGDPTRSGEELEKARARLL